jgi:hypothetical protein
MKVLRSRKEIPADVLVLPPRFLLPSNTLAAGEAFAI